MAARLRDEKPDFGSTTAVNQYAPGLAWIPRVVRDKLNPAALGSAITALAIAIGYVVNAQHDISRLKESVAESRKSMDDMHQKLDILQDIKTQLAVMGSQLNGISDEVDRQREWRSHIEDAAESGPHAKRHR